MSLVFENKLFATYFKSSFALDLFSYFTIFSSEILFLSARVQILLYVLFGVSKILEEIYISSILEISVFKDSVIYKHINT